MTYAKLLRAHILYVDGNSTWKLTWIFARKRKKTMNTFLTGGGIIMIEVIGFRVAKLKAMKKRRQSKDLWKGQRGLPVCDTLMSSVVALF